MEQVGYLDDEYESPLYRVREIKQIKGIVITGQPTQYCYHDANCNVWRYYPEYVPPFETPEEFYERRATDNYDLGIVDDSL